MSMVPEDLDRVGGSDPRFQAALNALLRLALEGTSLELLLQRMLERLLDMAWLPVDGHASILLARDGILQSRARVDRVRCPAGGKAWSAAGANEEVTGEPERAMARAAGDRRSESRVCEVPIELSGQRVGMLRVALAASEETDSQLRGFLAAVADILAVVVERKGMEASLRESEERFQLAVRGTDAGIWDWNLRTNEVYFSPRWKSMLGFGPDELKNEFSEWELRLHPDDRERALATVKAYLDGELADFEVEHRLRHRDGTYRWILARGDVVRDVTGKAYRMVGSHLDITERKRTEERLRYREARLIAARNLLQFLLPRAPLEVSGCRVDGASFAADYTQGDCFDYFSVSESRLRVAIMDVSGHGIDAALLMASTHAHLRSYSEAGFDLGTTMARTNRTLATRTETDRYITALMLEIEPQARQFSYCNAGHPAGFQLDRSGRLKRELTSVNLPLSIHENEQFRVEGPHPLEPGDVILLVTDGVFECRSPQGEPFGMQRPLEIVRQYIHHSNNTILNLLRSALRDFTRTRDLPDDVTMVLTRLDDV